MSGAFWNDKEVQLLRESYSNLEWEKICQRFPNRTRHAIRSKALAERMVRLLDVRPSWTYPEKTLLKKLWPRSPRDEIEAAIPRHAWTSICKMAPTLGVKRDTARYSRYPAIRFLREERRKRGLRTDVLAAELGAHSVQISKWERGEQVPRLRTFFDWAQALGCEVRIVPIETKERE